MTSGIYAIYDRSTRECLYVGQSTDVDIRWYHHQRLLRKNAHHNKGLQAHYNGRPNSLEHNLLEECPGEMLHEREIFWSGKLHPTYMGRKPGKSWRWGELSDRTLETMFQVRAEKAQTRFLEVNKKFGARVESLYLEGKSSEAIAQELPISFGDTLAILKTRGVRFRSKRESLGIEYARHKTKDQLKQEIEAHRASNRPWHELAEKWNCGTSTVRSLADELGVLNIKPAIPIAEWTDERLKAEILNLEAQGLTKRQVAKALGIGISTLWRRLYRLFPERYESTNSNAS